MEKLLITGGAGFIGSNLSAAAVQRGYDVTIIDNLATGNINNIKTFKKDLNFIKGDIRDFDLLKRITKNIDYIIHLAAIPSVPRSIENPQRSHDNNVNGTFNVLMAGRDNDVKKIVTASSSSVYGNRDTLGLQKISFKKETMKPMPLSPYAVTKLVGELYSKVFAHIFNLPSLCLRYFNVFGPRQNPNSQYSAVIPKFITTINEGKRPIIFGDGKQSRDFTYIDNVIEANLLAIKSTNITHGETINIACGDTHTLLDLVSLINKTLNKNVRPKFEDDRKGDVKHSKADITKAKKLLHYSPKISFEEGIKKAINWYLNSKTI